MEEKEKLKKGLKKPHRVPSFLFRRVKNLFDKNIRGRYTFDTEQVVGYFSGKASYEAEYSLRLFTEVQLLEKALSGYTGKRSLEVGCGYGRLTPWIAKHSQRHYVIEPESNLLDQVRTLYPEVNAKKGVAQSLPFDSNFFNLCVSWTVLQHIPSKTVAKAVDELKRVTKDCGVIVIAEETEGDWGRGEGRKIQVYESFFDPWDLNWKLERNLTTSPGHNGIVMRFEKTSCCVE